MPSWMFKEESNRKETKNRDSKKKPAQLKKNVNHAKQDVKVQDGTVEGKCVAGPVLTRVQVKKSDKIHPLKVKEAMSSANKTINRLLFRNGILNICKCLGITKVGPQRNKLRTTKVELQRAIK